MEIFVDFLNHAILINNTDLIYETLITIQLFVENTKEFIGLFLNSDILNITIKLIKSKAIYIDRIHQLSFSLIGDLLLGNTEECKVKIFQKILVYFISQYSRFGFVVL